MPRVVHFEIIADDAVRISKFYQNVFGWEVEKWDGPVDYWFLRTGNENEPGIDGAFGMRRDQDDFNANTINVSDIDETVKQIEANGGEIVHPKHTIPGVGHLAYFKDTEGNLWGIMQSDASAK